MLEKYAKCKDSADVVAAQKEYLEQLEVEHNRPKQGRKTLNRNLLVLSLIY